MDNNYKVFVAVRMKSTRLKRKALLELNGIPIIEVLFDYLSAIIPKHKIVICTSDSKNDDDLAKFCIEKSMQVFRGSAEDVMDRFLKAERNYPAEHIVRVTGDNPLTDPNLILKMLDFHIIGKYDYTFTNSFPAGARSEIIKTETLRKIHKNLYAPENSEYMTYMLNRPDRIKVGCYTDTNYINTYPHVSVTLDNSKDYEQLINIFDSFGDSLPTPEKLLQWCSDNQGQCILAPKVKSQDINKHLYGYKDER
ncbi:hypothetical protein N9770_05480 [Amylibacter sp.]|nr:hypothetical protein [Amylibacter sp.]